MNFGLSDAAIATIHAILEAYPAVEKAVIYGSRAKGNYKDGSDIDLTLYGDTLTLDMLLRIAGDLDDSSLPYMVDVCVFDHLDNLELQDHIRRVGKVFYERGSRSPDK